MRKIIIATAAVIGLGVIATSADARTYTEEVTPNRDKCYLVQYVPALYKVNTRGKKVKGQSTSWHGDYVDGGVIIKRRNPAVYIQTRRLIEPDHYTLVPKGC